MTQSTDRPPSEPQTIRWTVSKAGLFKLAHDKLSTSEYRILLHMIAGCSLEIVKFRVPMEFYIDKHPILEEGMTARFVFDGKRSDVMASFPEITPRSVTHSITGLTRKGYLMRPQEFSIRLMFSFVLHPSLFTLE